MTRHRVDQSEPLDPAPRLRHFLRFARQEFRHPAIRALHVRRPAATAEARLRPLLQVIRRQGG